MTVSWGTLPKVPPGRTRRAVATISLSASERLFCDICNLLLEPQDTTAPRNLVLAFFSLCGDRRRDNRPANPAACGRGWEISHEPEMRGGPAWTRTRNQTVMSGRL